MPKFEFVQNKYVQKCDNSYATKTIGLSQRDVRWKTINIKPEIPNITQTWKNKIGFMVQPYHFYKDIVCKIQVPMLETMIKEYDDLQDKIYGGKIMVASKFKTSDKGQSVQSYDAATTNPPTSLYSQLNQNKNRGICIGLNLEWIDCYSGWTSIYRGHWDDFQQEYMTNHTAYSSYSMCQLGKYGNVRGKQATAKVMKNGIVGRGCPYRREPAMYTPQFMRDYSVQKYFLKPTVEYIYRYIYICYIYICMLYICYIYIYITLHYFVIS